MPTEPNDESTTEPLECTNIQELLQQGQRIGLPKQIEGYNPYAVVPPGHDLRNLECFAYAPSRIRQDVDFSEIDSFEDYVRQYQEDDTRLFAVIEPHSLYLRAVIDYHGLPTVAKEAGAGPPSWCTHQARYQSCATPEWNTISCCNKRWMKQHEFCDWIQENHHIFSQPPGAQMLEIAETLEGKRKVEFSRGVRQDNGDLSLKWTETTETNAGRKGDLSVPSDLVMVAALFPETEPYKIRAKLNFRIDERGVQFRYTLLAPHLLVRDLGNTVCQRLQDNLGIRVWRGMPELPTQADQVPF